MKKVDKKGLFDPYSIEIEESSEVNEILNYSDILTEIARTLIDYRNKNKLTQEDLAKKLNMNQSMVTKLESGRYNATFKMLLKISYTLEKNSHLFLKIIEDIRNVLEYKEEYKNIMSIGKYKCKLDYNISNIYLFNNKNKSIYEKKITCNQEYKLYN